MRVAMNAALILEIAVRRALVIDLLLSTIYLANTGQASGTVSPLSRHRKEICRNFATKSNLLHIHTQRLLRQEQPSKSQHASFPLISKGIEAGLGSGSGPGLAQRLPESGR